MKCGFCQKELPDDALEKQPRCGLCPGGCRKIHCPFCGYDNPVMPSYLKRLARKKNDQGGSQ
ncbi:MAG TPA: hypothetical protein ENO11_04140 [Desulfobacteraceae bacterium]|nr:hypothetical protein [Desulfobacteraceae bacterium]